MAKIVKTTRDGRAGAIEKIMRELFPGMDEPPEYAQKLIDQYIHDIRTSEQ